MLTIYQVGLEKIRMNHLSLTELEQKQPKINLSLVWFSFSLILLIILSFITLKLDIAALFSSENWHSGVDFLAGFAHPTYNNKFFLKIIHAGFETLAMSIIGTVIAAILGLSMALAAVSNSNAFCYPSIRLILNTLRSVPELVWAAILLVALGLGPFPGTVALALHTTGVLGRLLTESIENLPAESVRALRLNGASKSAILLYATLPLLLPQLTSYSLYRWENNIRAAAVLGVFGAGGLGQMLYFHLSLFQTSQACSVIIAMIILVALVDTISYRLRQYFA